jgi:hypothetical protein
VLERPRISLVQELITVCPKPLEQLAVDSLNSAGIDPKVAETFQILTRHSNN